MGKAKLSEKNVWTLPAKNRKRTDYRDTLLENFVLRVSPTGLRSFCVTYHRAGKVRRYTLGTTPPLKLAEAREEARKVLARVALGDDPMAQKKAQRDATRRDAKRPTFAALAEHFLQARKDRLRPTTYTGWERIVRVEIGPGPLGSKHPGEITRADVRRFVEEIASSGRPYWANRVFEVVRRVFTWATEEDLLPASPCVGLRKPAQERPRDRVLTSEEIARIWRVLDDQGLIGQAVKLLFYTGARRGEVLSMEWAEIDSHEGVWRIPSTKTKAGVPHVVPLTEGALATLEPLRSASEDSPWVFTSPKGDAPIWSPQKAATRIRQQSGVAFRLHDIRRTVRAGLSEMGVPEHVAEAVIGHVPPKLVRTYNPPNPHLYFLEKRHALERWGRRLEAVISHHADTATATLGAAAIR